MDITVKVYRTFSAKFTIRRDGVEADINLVVFIFTE